MRLYKFSIFLIIFGIVLAVVFGILGYAKFALFIIFPVIYSSSPLSLIPFALIFAGILLLMLSPFFTPVMQEQEWAERGEAGKWEEPPAQRKKEKKFGGVILIGPIPIIIGNDRKLLYIAGAIAIIILLIFLFYYLGR